MPPESSFFPTPVSSGSLGGKRTSSDKTVSPHSHSAAGDDHNSGRKFSLLPPPAVDMGPSMKSKQSHRPSLQSGQNSFPVSPPSWTANSTSNGGASVAPSPPATQAFDQRRMSQSRPKLAGSPDVAARIPPPPTRNRRIIQVIPGQRQPKGKDKPQDGSAGKSSPLAVIPQVPPLTGSGHSPGKAVVPAKDAPKRPADPATTDPADIARSRKAARKTAHSLIERRRRSKMNEVFQTLREIVPACGGTSPMFAGQTKADNDDDDDDDGAGLRGGNGPGMHKLAILEATVEYLRYLERCVGILMEKNESDRPVPIDIDTSLIPSLADGRMPHPQDGPLVTQAPYPNSTTKGQSYYSHARTPSAMSETMTTEATSSGMFMTFSVSPEINPNLTNPDGSREQSRPDEQRFALPPSYHKPDTRYGNEPTWQASEDNSPTKYSFPPSPASQPHVHRQQPCAPSDLLKQTQVGNYRSRRSLDESSSNRPPCSSLQGSSTGQVSSAEHHSTSPADTAVALLMLRQPGNEPSNPANHSSQASSNGVHRRGRMSVRDLLS